MFKKEEFVKQFKEEHGAHPKEFKGRPKDFHKVMNASSDKLVRTFNEAVEEETADQTVGITAGMAQLFPE
jgi:hypothetical protein